MIKLVAASKTMTNSASYQYERLETPAEPLRTTTALLSRCIQFSISSKLIITTRFNTDCSF